MRLINHDIIIRPIITEKSSRLMEKNQYTFEVHPHANKVMIRGAVQEIFKVKVDKVHTMKIHSKPKRMGMFIGKSRSWKKAIITVREGQKIDFFEGATV